MSLFIHERGGGSSLGRGKGSFRSCQTPAARDHSLSLPWLSFLVPGQNGSSRSLRDCALRICLDTDDSDIKSLLFFFSLPFFKIFYLFSIPVKAQVKTTISLGPSQLIIGCRKLWRPPTVPSPFHKSLPISHRWRCDILPTDFSYRVSRIHVGDCPIRLFLPCRPLKILFFFLSLNLWFSITTMFFLAASCFFFFIIYNTFLFFFFLEIF